MALSWIELIEHSSVSAGNVVTRHTVPLSTIRLRMLWKAGGVLPAGERARCTTRLTRRSTSGWPAIVCSLTVSEMISGIGGGVSFFAVLEMLGFHAGMGPVLLNTNRSKRSICLDLKKPAGREAVLRLLKDADVLVYNVRPQAMARLQLGYDVVSKINPRLVYAGVFGFGQDGPYAAKPAYDDLIQGATALPALMAQTSADGVPRYVPNALVDRIVGLTAVGAICASLVHRDRTGRGQRVDIPMFETMAGFVMGDHMGGLTYEPPLGAIGSVRELG